jgi:PqqD family protein of HPr-rel-A system
MKWRTGLKSEEQLRQMGQDYVVYDAVSGSTHLLGAAAGQILLHLERVPMATQELIKALNADWPDTAESDFEQEIEAVLNELQSMDLVECA